MARSLEDTRAAVYLLLLEQLRPLSRRKILEVTEFQPGTLDRALKFLYDKELIEKFQGRQEVYYYAKV